MNIPKLTAFPAPKGHAGAPSWSLGRSAGLGTALRRLT